MGLSASMWGSVSGLLSHGEKMNVVGNNIANVSTVGFKAQRMDFQDFIYQEGHSASGITQVGRGVNICAIMGDFSQGSFETTNSSTDLAIGGKGYFQVRSPNSQEKFYTRAGDFFFNTAGELQNPNGYVLQGWKIDNSDTLKLGTLLGYDVTAATDSPFKGSGSPRDIILDTWNVAPKATNRVELQMNLTAQNGYDKYTVVESPMTSLFSTWRGQQKPPLSSEAYAMQSSITVFDEGGVAHELTMYLDQVSRASDDYTITNLPNGYSLYEYIVTIPPAEDQRTYGGVYDAANKMMIDDPNDPANTIKKFADTEAAGVVMVGTLTFNSSGQLVNQTAYTYGAQSDPGAGKAYTGDPTLATSWQPTKVSSNGYPVFSANFTGQPLSSSVGEYMDNNGSSYFPTQNCAIELNLGLKSTSVENTWSNPNGTLEDLKTQAGVIDYHNAAILNSLQREEGATTSYASSSLTRTRTQNGYSSGMLSNISVDPYGVVTGAYSNGISLDLYQISLYDFSNEQGLRREGGNLFSQTQLSGNPSVGVAKDSSFGSVNAYALEQSNVDLSREFVQMISTQRGFQANSKSITTVDTMLETVINMKR